MGMRMITKNPVMARGLRIDYRVKVLGFPLRWTSLITEYERPFVFVDEALRSPYQYWHHRHSFRPVPEGTVVVDDVKYALPLGPLGAVANALFVKRQLREIFEFRQEKIADILGVRGKTITQPEIKPVK